MKRWWLACAIAVAIVGGGCSSSTTTSASVPVTSPRDPGAAGLKAAATAYARAYLTGDANLLLSVTDHRCHPKGWANASSLRRAKEEAARFLQRFRDEFQRYAKRDPATIHVKSTEIRNLRPTTGEAETHYGLPASIEGNYNWNSYSYVDGQWRISCDTLDPIGGRGGSKTAESPTTAA